MIAYRIHNDVTDETTGYYEHEEEARAAVECAREFHQSDDWRAEEIDITMSPIGLMAQIERQASALDEANRQRSIFAGALQRIFEQSGLTSLTLEQAVEAATKDTDEGRGV